MEDIWIIGSGKFGILAAKSLIRQERAMNLTLVDQDRDALDQAEKLGCRIEEKEGADFLHACLTSDSGPDWIVPAVPIHLAWEWCRLKMGKERLRVDFLPKGLKTVLPNPMDGADGEIYVTHADFFCPPNCNEPDEYCTRTGEPRKEDMFRLLAKVDFPGIRPIVIQSVQLGPGLGGYTPRALFEFLDNIAQSPGPLFAATACRCHGVLSGGVLKEFDPGQR
ncbi:hypothetical protein [Desulfospira joergensenii]|uniref:hypothetical protein n=1 Tax=Desulfospira joergensenii TaxID=53329 RepID=UPI0003B37538|nr:hypothetical protein [Desulfospira joergensenii]